MLTVLIASRNGANLLPSVLEAYSHLETPAGGWKLVIVDNGSTDRTKEIILSYRDRLPITYVFEPKPGKNSALNTGLENASGDLVVFTDDDIFPRADWLSQLRRAADTHATFAIFAGIIQPRWEIHPEDWILAWVPLSVAYGVSSAKMTEGATTPSNTFGGNMAIRRQIFSDGYRFDPLIGPRGTHYAIGSETQLVRQLVAKGLSIWASAEAVVEHFVPRAHLQSSWILGRAVRYGRGQHRLSRMEPNEQPPMVAGIPRYVLRAMLTQAKAVVAAALTRDVESLFRARWELNYLRGVAIEARLMAREEQARASEAKRTKIALIGPLTNGNLGNAAFEAAVAQHVRDYFPDAEIYGCCIDSLETLTRERVQLFPLKQDTDPSRWRKVEKPAVPPPRTAPTEPSLRARVKSIPFARELAQLLRAALEKAMRPVKELRFWLRSYRFLTEFRLLIVRGGGQLSDTWNGAWNHPYTLLTWATLARLSGTRFVILSVGADPVSPLSRWMLKRVLASASYHSFRDQSSRKIVESWGVFDGNRVLPDLAFSLKTPTPHRASSPRKDAPVVGVSPMPYFDPRVWPDKDAAAYQKYLRTLAAFVANLMGRGYAIVLFASQVRLDPPVLVDLKKLLVEEHGIDGSSGMIRETSLRTVDDFLSLIPQLDFVVASRLHGLLLAQLMYTPSLAISYDHKVDSLMAALGLAEFCVDIRTIEVPNLIERFAALEAGQDRVAETLQRRVAEYREALERQYDAVIRPG